MKLKQCTHLQAQKVLVSSRARVPKERAETPAKSRRMSSYVVATLDLDLLLDRLAMMESTLEVDTDFT